MAKIYKQPTFSGRKRAMHGLPTVWGDSSRHDMGLLADGSSMNLTDGAIQVLGMFIAIISGSSLNWVINKLKLFQENTAVRNLIVSIFGAGLTWKLPYLLNMVGLSSIASKFEESDTLKNILKGMTTMFGFSTAMAGFGMLSSSANIKIPFIASETSLLSTITEATDSMKSVSGVFTDKDYTTKIEDLKTSLAQLEAEFIKLPAPSTMEMQSIYGQVKNQIGYAQINISNAEGYLKEAKIVPAENDILNAQENIMTTKAFLAGLTAMTSLPAPIDSAVSPTPTETVTITNPESGEQVEVVAPANPETPIAIENQPVGGAFDVNLIENWANYVAPTLNWTPTQVITGFLLRWIANGGHVWAYGKNTVEAYRSMAGVNDPAYVTYDGKVFEIDSVEGAYDLIVSIKGY